MAIINGTDPNGEFLLGTDDADKIVGFTGNDTLLASGGNDTLDGGAGDDTSLGGPGDDVFQYSFTLNQAPGDTQTVTFTDWLSEKYGKDFGDELPDFERGHDHHHHGKHHHHDHGKHHHHHGKHHHDHGKHHHHQAKHDHHHSHHHKHGGCDDHHSHEWGLSQSFFAKNYSEWIREVVVADLLAQGFDLDVNGDGQIDIRLNKGDPDGTPRIEGLSDEQLSAIFGDRDEVTLRHHHHGHDKWYSNSYTSSSGDGDTTVASGDGFDSVGDFDIDNSLFLGSDRIQFNFTADQNWDAGFTDDAEKLAFLESFFEIAQVDAFDTPDPNDVNSTRISLNDGTWSTTLEATLLDTPDVLAALDIYVNDVFIG